MLQQGKEIMSQVRQELQIQQGATAAEKSIETAADLAGRGNSDADESNGVLIRALGIFLMSWAKTTPP